MFFPKPRNLFCGVLASALFLGLLPLTQAAPPPSAPSVDRVEPPNWWAGQALGPVRVLLHGHNLAGAQVQAKGSGLTARNIRVSAEGTYVFADVAP